MKWRNGGRKETEKTVLSEALPIKRNVGKRQGGGGGGGGDVECHFFHFGGL